MNAILYSEGSVVVTNATCICKLEKFGFGARRLYPMVVPPESKTTFPCQTVPTHASEENDAELGHSLSPLLLLDEEAFFLLHKGHLSLCKGYGKEEEVSVEELWSLFMLKDRNFPLKYKVYEYYKDKSYVIRTGLNFGVDYCAYQSLPSECHSEMCITVVDALRAHEYKQIMMTQGSGSASVHNPASQACWMDELGWRHVTTLTRLIPDVMKLCILCYVLPAEWNATASTPSPSATADSAARAMVTDTCDVGTDIAPAQSSSAEQSDTRAPPVDATTTATATVSPYFDLLFSNKAPSPAATNSASANHNNTTNLACIDFSTPHCLDRLTVRPVTVLVRRLPAPSETYQTINMIQAQYQAASTAQKKRELKALKKKQHKQMSKQGSSNEQNGQSKQSSQKYSKSTTTQEASARRGSEPTQKNVVVTAMDAIHPADRTECAKVSGMETSAAEQPQQELLTGAPAAPTKVDDVNTSTQHAAVEMPTITEEGDKKLSGRQKRVTKQESKQIKKTRRDHTENRSKVMSNKNQCLLNMMNASESQNDNSASISDNSGNIAAPVMALLMDVVDESSHDAAGNTES